MRAMRRIWHYLKAIGQVKRNRSYVFGWLIRRPQIGLAVMVYEASMLFANRLEPKLKELAELKTAALVNCEFCLDIGSALARSGGITEQQIRDLPRYRTSEAFSELEKLVLDYAVAMTATPAGDLDDLRTELLTRMSKGQFAELTATIAWENQRARFNRGLGVLATGMSDGAVCALPERPAS